MNIVIVQHYDSSMDRLLQGSERVPVVSLYHVFGVQDECPVILIDHPKEVCVTLKAVTESGGLALLKTMWVVDKGRRSDAVSCS